MCEDVGVQKLALLQAAGEEQPTGLDWINVRLKVNPMMNLLTRIYMRILKMNILFTMNYVFYAMIVSLRTFVFSCLC